MIKKSIFGVAVSLIFAGGIFVVVAHAQTDTLTPEKQTIITQNCILSQTALQHIQYNDTATRVNRGQGYETILSRLMTPLNTRTTSGGYNDSATTLIDITKRYQQVLDSFKNHYSDYDNAISSSLKVKCKDNQAKFYGYLEEARRQRQTIAGDVDNLSSLVNEYRAGVLKLGAEVK